MTRMEQQLKGLEWFKDWSNYMLVTTVAALGWVTVKNQSMVPEPYIKIVVGLFAASIAFAIFTLALIPLVTEEITEETTSFYDVAGKFRLFWSWGPETQLKLKTVCWPQHVLFLLGVGIYAVGVNCA